MRKKLRVLALGALGTLILAMSGCGEHLQKDRETLVSPSQRGTEAEQQVEGPVDHGEAPSDTRTYGKADDR